MKRFQNLGRALSKNELTRVLGGLVQPTCTAKADCGTNGSVSCSGYTGNGCTATDDKGVACQDQNGTMHYYACSVS